MAQQEEPLYDFPEPTEPSEGKFPGHQRGCGSLKSISVLDRLLLTVPVWLQLSINAATALHILQREPPGVRNTFLVRKSRTSKRNVLCVRLVDDSVPSFVEQFGIRAECSTLSLETSAISFPDLPRLISFYCVSRDVLPFPLELPEAIAKATSHKELESISHMGVEFWNSHLNVRGPREAPKTQEKSQDSPISATATANSQTIPASQPDSGPQLDSELNATPESDPNSTLFREFCPIETRSPRELDCGSGLGALCFINPLFLQSDSILSKRRLMKRSFKVRVSAETSTLLSPPLARPPPPPLMPKTKGKCKALKQAGPQNFSDEGQTQMEASQLPTVAEHPPEDTDYMQPPPAIISSLSPSLSPYLAPPLPPKMSSAPQNPSSASLATHYQFPSLSPKAPSASLSPYQSPSSSPFSLTPFCSPAMSPLVEEARQKTPTFTSSQHGLEKKIHDNEVEELHREMEAATVNTDSRGSFDGLEGATGMAQQTAVQKQSDIQLN
ncbi:ras and Rab interactor 1-like isoform X1 [Entelurus aequoreus]|uniref:ras and Rab interactor 1-like isoform X1 n=1 Tax=Entelurus aequoreus TaxID=161455 RepID=UPI002B1E7C42|nr:ras and Rab interactor 1-like isoform X1 [Entelurus aequoreus]